MKIDLVIPYVDSSDPNWQTLFNDYNPIKDKEVEAINAPNRFRGQGSFFRYWFRCVERNMPWINNIFLLVQSESQVPNWINRETVKVVTHNQFIPAEYLPTFNSTCIEMFLWNIPELGEYFIYSNDDFYAFSPLKENHYFEFGKIKNSSFGMKFNKTMYQYHCLKGYCLAYNRNFDSLKEIAKGTFPAFNHLMRPYLKSKMKEAFEDKKGYILDSISRFREEKNINIYYFDHYIIRHGYQLPRINIKSSVISSKTTSNNIRLILDSVCPNILCIQDDGEIDIYENFTLNSYFERNYTKKSKYEA